MCRKEKRHKLHQITCPECRKINITRRGKFNCIYCGTPLEVMKRNPRLVVKSRKKRKSNKPC